MENKNKKKLEIVYPKAGLRKRGEAFILDFLLLALLSLLLFTLFNMLIPHFPSYQSVLKERKEIEENSSLYTSEGKSISEEVKDDSRYTTFEMKKEYLSEHLEEFYTSSYVTEENVNSYNTRKREAKDASSLPLFLEKDNKIIENNVVPEELYDFYYTEASEYAPSCLFNSSSYTETVRKMSLAQILNVFVSVSISFTLLYLVLPLTFFSRGRCTLGRRLFHLGYVEVTAFNPKASKYVLRFFFEYFFFLILDVAAFLLPFLISLGMTFFSKRGQSLTDYVFNEYLVNFKDEDIYKDYSEYLDRKSSSSSEMKLENQDLELK